MAMPCLSPASSRMHSPPRALTPALGAGFLDLVPRQWPKRPSPGPDGARPSNNPVGVPVQPAGAAPAPAPCSAGEALAVEPFREHTCFSNAELGPGELTDEDGNLWEIRVAF